jgi:hypothetical protein
VAKIPELKAGAPPAKPAAPQVKPLNAKCPVRTDQNVKPEFSLKVGENKVIAFCCGSCLGKFNRAPGAYIGNIPELRPAPAKKPEEKPAAGKPEEKKDAKPAETGPCEIKKVVKGMWCVKCDRELTMDDVRNKLCKRCETKPAEIEYCAKRTGLEFHADCHPNKKDTKPVS